MTTTLSGLLPYTKYSCSIAAYTSAGGGPAATITVTTQQDGEFVSFKCYSVIIISVPSGPPENFTITVTSHRITFSWSPPFFLKWNGVITSYNLSCNVGKHFSSIKLSGTSFEVPIIPYTSYACTVSAATVAGNGPATTVISGVTDEASECMQLNYFTTRAVN